VSDYEWLQAGKAGLFAVLRSRTTHVCDAEINKLTVGIGFGVVAWEQWVGAVHGHPRTISCAEISSVRSIRDGEN